MTNRFEGLAPPLIILSEQKGNDANDPITATVDNHLMINKITWMIQDMQRILYVKNMHNQQL